MNGPHFPSAIAAQADPGSGGVPSEVDVGEILRRLDAGRQLSGAELERHIADCETLWKRAYARFRAHHIPADRDEALLWLHRQNEAILMRSPGVQAQRHADFEQRLAAGVDRVLPTATRRVG